MYASVIELLSGWHTLFGDHISAVALRYPNMGAALLVGLTQPKNITARKGFATRPSQFHNILKRLVPRDSYVAIKTE
jgi:hypothetical protein